MSTKTLKEVLQLMDAGKKFNASREYSGKTHVYDEVYFQNSYKFSYTEVCSDWTVTPREPIKIIVHEHRHEERKNESPEFRVFFKEDPECMNDCYEDSYYTSKTFIEVIEDSQKL